MSITFSISFFHTFLLFLLYLFPCFFFPTCVFYYVHISISLQHTFPYTGEIVWSLSASFFFIFIWGCICLDWICSLSVENHLKNLFWKDACGCWGAHISMEPGKPGSLKLLHDGWIFSPFPYFLPKQSPETTVVRRKHQPHKQHESCHAPLSAWFLFLGSCWL